MSSKLKLLVSQDTAGTGSPEHYARLLHFRKYVCVAPAK